MCCIMSSYFPNIKEYLPYAANKNNFFLFFYEFHDSLILFTLYLHYQHVYAFSLYVFGHPQISHPHCPYSSKFLV